MNGMGDRDAVILSLPRESEAGDKPRIRGHVFLGNLPAGH